MFPGSCIVKNEHEYSEFIKCLKDGDKVAVQVFHPKGDTVLDSTHQYWQIYEGEWRTGQVLYDGDSHPIRTDGCLCYWNSEKPSGKVFASRIVPWQSEFTPRFPKKDRMYTSDAYLTSERPVYEPLWSRQSFFLDKYGSNHGSVQKSVNSEKYPGTVHHSWTVHDGTIIQVFDCGDYEFSGTPGYLYSEDCSE